MAEQSVKSSKKSSNIKKLAELILDDEDFGANISVIQFSRTPQANTPEDRSLSSRTHNSFSQIIKPIGKEMFEVEVVAASLTTEIIGSLSPYCIIIY